MTADGPRPGETNWYAFNLDQMWQMLAGESAVSADYAVAAWLRTADLCRDEAAALRAALARLEDGWPASQPAGRAFQAWGRQLVDAMELSEDAGARNASVLRIITDRIAAAKDDLTELVAQDRHYLALVEGRARPEPDEIVPANWRLALEEHARQIMRNLENAVYDDSTQFVTEPLFDGKPRFDAGADAFAGEETEALPTQRLDEGIRPLDPPRWDDPSVGNVGATDDGSDDLARVVSPGGGGSTPTLPGGALPSHADTVLDGVAPVGGLIAGGPLGSGPGGVGQGGSFVDTPGGRGPAPGVAPGANPGGPGPIAGPGAAGGPGRVPGGSGMVPFMPPMAAPPAGGGRGGATTPRPPRPGQQGLFEVPKGGPSMLVPPDEPKEHDPGPGVIGIDR